ncbi:uncharacterized protein LOC135339486 isoform X2 [Halichondria panicea]|uniref:uncharacterized protein LOC135339486 isoform X2 n=1 Tax=Halichondria panicea TaxID=6063 RepID=UPI00312B2C53
MSGSKIVLPSSDAEQYNGNILLNTVSSIAKPKGLSGRNAYTSDNRPSWWPKDVVFCCLKGSTAATNGITTVHRRKVLAAFLEKCPEQYTISPPVYQVGTKRARITADSKIVLPSSNVEEYSGSILRGIISHIVNPKGQSSRNFFTRDNSPSWWPKDVAFSHIDGITAANQRKILATFFEKCPEQYTVSPPVDQQNSASIVETDQPEVPAVGTKRAKMMPGSKIVLPSSDAEEYSGNILQTAMIRIANSKGWGKNFYTSDNCPSWWPKDMVFAPMTGLRSIGIVTSVHWRKVLAAFLEKCPEQYTISPPVDTKRARMMPGSKIVLPSSDVEEYIGNILQSTVSRIAKPKGMILFSYKLCEFLVGQSGGRNAYTSDNRPSWWPKDVVFCCLKGPKAATNGITTVHRRKVLAAFLEKCPEQYTISRPVDQQNSASADLLKHPLTGTKKTRIMADSKIVLPSSNAEEYSGIDLRTIISRIVNPKGKRNFYTSDNCPSWWPKDVAFTAPTGGSKAIANNITVGNMRMILASFLEKCPEQYTISPGAQLLSPTSSPHVGDKQPVREVSPRSSSESDQEEPVGMNQTPPTGAYRTRSVGATISTAAQHASPKLILPSSCANDYSQPSLISLIRNILNPKRRHFIYSSANCPSWWPTDVPFIRAEDMEAKDRTKVLTAFLKKCPDQYTISPPVDQQNSASIVETDQPEDTIVDVQMNVNESDAEFDASIPSDPEDLVNSLEQHLLDSRKRRLEAERKVEELTEEVKRLREERKYIGSIVKRSRLHH